MKILALIDKRESVNSKLHLQIQQGRFYHAYRINLVKSDTKLAVVSINIFERSLAILLKAVCIDYKKFVVNRAIKKMGDCQETFKDQNVNPGLNFQADHQPPTLQPLQPKLQRQTSNSRPVSHIQPETIISRPIYSSFSIYRQEREEQGEPVDLLIGRGTLINACTPKLNGRRYVLETGMNKSYHPFTVDADSDVLPDFKASITNLEQMAYFPDESVDDIYLERIYPASTLRNAGIFFNAARILKKAGTLVVDFNDGYHTDMERKKQIEAMRSVFDEFRIPFTINVAMRNSDSRSDLDFPKFVCIKYDDFDPTYLLEKSRLFRLRLFEATLRLEQLFRDNRVDFH